jgi:hypothetical protein
MTTSLIALVAAALGALVAGGANLWLAQRTERRLARVGASQLKAELEAADERIKAALEEGTWWSPGLAPSIPAWDLYQHALVAQLLTHRTAKLQAAVDQVRRANLAAELIHANAARYEAAFLDVYKARIEKAIQDGVPDPVQAVDHNRQFQKGLKGLLPPMTLEDRFASGLLQPTTQRIEDALAELSALPELQSRVERFLGNRVAIAGTLVTVLVLIAGLVTLSWVLAPEQPIPASSVATAIAAKLGAKAVACEALPGQTGSAWTCVARFESPTCQAAQADAPQSAVVAAVVSERGGQVSPAPSDAPPTVTPSPSPIPSASGLGMFTAAVTNKQLAILVRETGASEDCLEADDARPAPDGSNVQDGIVKTPVDDSSDVSEVAVPDPGKMWP